MKPDGGPESVKARAAPSAHVVTTVAGSNGAFKVTVPIRSGSNLITAAATVGRHASGWAQVTVTGA
jgi:hypothetical protein